MSNAVLAGKTALVTGGSSGMGAASARLLAQDGAAVLIMGRNEDSLIQSRDAILQQVPGARIEIFAGDASEEKDVRSALDKAHGIAGRLDILVPAVGGAGYKPLLLLDAATFMEEYKINFISTFLMVRYGVPLMEHGGAIVCISTAGVVQPMRGLTAYVSAKAALERFVRAAAHELGSANVRINAVRPGMTRAAGTKFMYDIPGLADRYAEETILGRTGESDDIARVVRFLAGPESAWVTGQCMSADGGQEQGKVPEILDDIYGVDVMDQVRAGKSPEI